MADYISRETAVEWFAAFAHMGEDNIPTDTVISNLKHAIPASDVAPVVRCRDCKYFLDANVNGNGFLICLASNMEITPDDFCSYGERRKPDEEK